MPTFDEQFVTNADGSGYDHARKCHASTNSSGNSGHSGDNDADSEGDSEQVVNEVKCCGNYPNRFEFLTHGGNRACCGEVTYNTNRLECCEGDFLSQIGSCDAQRR